jgi:hypothetical protein
LRRKILCLRSCSHFLFKNVFLKVARADAKKKVMAVKMTVGFNNAVRVFIATVYCSFYISARRLMCAQMTVPIPLTS